MDGIPTRVGHLENEMASLHEDNIRTRSAISTLGSQVATLTDTMKDLAIKLDQQRTRRPDMSAMAAWAGVLLMVGALAYAPISGRVYSAEESINSLNLQTLKHAKEAGKYEKAIDVMENEINYLRAASLQVGGTRFTGEDGQRLYDKVWELHKKP